MLSIDIKQKLANKFYVSSIGLFCTIAGIFGFLFLFNSVLGLSLLVSMALSYFLIVFFRAVYDQAAVYEVKFEQIDFAKNLILALVGTAILMVLYYLLQNSLGGWALPVTVIVSSRIFGRIRKIFWPDTTVQLPEFFKIYAQKLETYALGMYGFFLALALVTYGFVYYCGLSSFFYAFAIGTFVALVCEQLYDLARVYETEITTQTGLLVCALSLIFAIATTATVFVLTHEFGLAGKLATIAGVVLLKLVQPLTLNLFLKK